MKRLKWAIARWKRRRARARQPVYPRITAQQWELYQACADYRERRDWMRYGWNG